MDDEESEKPLTYKGHEVVIRGVSDGHAEVFYKGQYWGMLDLSEMLKITYDLLSSGRRFKKWRRRE